MTPVQWAMLVIGTIIAIGIYVCRDIKKIQKENPELLRIGPEET